MIGIDDKLTPTSRTRSQIPVRPPVVGRPNTSSTSKPLPRSSICTLSVVGPVHSRTAAARTPACGAIGQRLLDDTIDNDFDLRIERSIQAPVLKLDLDMKLLGTTVEAPQQGRKKSQIVQHRRTEIEGELANPLRQVLRQLLGFRKTMAR